MGRVRIAEQLPGEDLGVLAQEGFGIERGARVVEIHLTARLQMAQFELRGRTRRGISHVVLGHPRVLGYDRRINDFRELQVAD